MDRSSPFGGIHVYLGCSSQDQPYLERLRIHLRLMEANGLIQVWDEASIQSGAQHFIEIEHMIAIASVAVLLVSADFLASQEIAEHILPLILEKARLNTMTILTVIVSYSDFQDSPLAPYKPINNPARPLKTMGEGEMERVCHEVVQAIRAIQRGNQRNNKVVDAVLTRHSEDAEPFLSESSVMHQPGNTKLRRFAVELNSPEMEQLSDALLHAFPSTSDLKLLVSYELHENIEVIAPGSSLAEKVHSLVVWAISYGKVKVLIDGALKRNPRNPKLRRFAIQVLDEYPVDQLSEAILHAFPSTSDLKLLVSYELHQNIEVIAPGGSLAERVYNLIMWAMSRGMEKTLIDGALRRNPRNPKLRRFAMDHGF